jgi:nicotinate-nucleotide adenylyltransferase
VRLRLARAAFPGDDVVLDEQARTIDTLRAHPEWDDPIFLVGADEFADFLAWKEPESVLRRARLAVATRPGFLRERLQAVLEELEHPERVLFFEIEPTPVASRDLRTRLAAGKDVSAEVPSAVLETIRSGGFYAA